MISLEKIKISTPLQKLPKIVGDLGKLFPKALKSCPKSNKLPNLVTLHTTVVIIKVRVCVLPIPRYGVLM